MPAFDPESTSSSAQNYINREIAMSLIDSARDYVVERAACEAIRGVVSTYTVPGEYERQIAIVHGIYPAPDNETILVVHNEIKPNPDRPGEKLASLAAWTINRSFIGYRQEIVYHDKEEAWEMPHHVPLILNYADEHTDGEIALHLHMLSHVMDPTQRVSLGEDVQPSRGTVDFLLKACFALNLCTEATHNRHVTKLA